VVNFDEKFRTIIKFPYQQEMYLELLYWLHDNTSGSADVKVLSNHGNVIVFVGFENPEDALVFKIRFSK